MEDNSSSDDEVNDSPCPKLGGKKLKLNDGSSHDSIKDAAVPGDDNDNDEVVDSGISADKSEGTSSDDHLSSSGPSNEVVNVGTSGNNVRAILLNICQPKRDRNYRKRKTPDKDSDNNESSRDSDDLSIEENVIQPSRETDNTSEGDSDDMQQLMATCSEGSPSANSNSSRSSSSSSSYSNYSFDSDDMLRIQSVDTSEDEVVWRRPHPLPNEDQGTTVTPPVVLSKQRPKHNYLILREIINREMGLTFPSGKTTQSDVMFEQKFYGSLHAVYRLKKLHHLNKHTGCVNSINFHPEGHLLASGSDDTNVVVWDWARNRALQTIKTGHKSNVFQSKFLHLNAQSQLNIVTCARDGQVRLVQCSPSGCGTGEGGAGVSRRRLAAHARAAHKLHVSAREPHEVMSAGEDGLVVLADVRADRASRLIHVKEQGATVPLYSVAGHPGGHHLLLAGRDRFLRVYDRRHAQRPLALYCPNTFSQGSKEAKKISRMHLTCAVYNHDGTQILGSYNDDDIYLFDTKLDIYQKDNMKEEFCGYRHRYGGHRNSATFKGVAFFGPRSQYVVSGSECGHLYVWHAESEAIVQWLHADASGVVNCIEAHPRFPVLATSGLDKNVKIWIPNSQGDPEYAGMEKIIRENGVARRSPLFEDFLPTLYSAWRSETRMYADDDIPAIRGNIEFDGNACTAF